MSDAIAHGASADDGNRTPGNFHIAEFVLAPKGEFLKTHLGCECLVNVLDKCKQIDLLSNEQKPDPDNYRECTATGDAMKYLNGL